MRDSLIEAYRRERRAIKVKDYVREDLGTLVRHTPLDLTWPLSHRYTNPDARDDGER